MKVITNMEQTRMETHNWERGVIEKVLLETVKEQRRRRRWGIFFKLTWLILIGAVLYYYFVGSSDPLANQKQVAMIDLTGEISGSNQTYDNMYEALHGALDDKNTIAVIIRANSPGGSPVYSDMLYNEIKRLRKKYPTKPIDVVVEEVCASGCYYIASAADKIYASPASIVGSIGVIYTGFGVTGLMQKIGVDSRLLISGKNKAMGYPFIPANPEQDAIQQQMLDEVHEQFINAVKQGRGNRLATSNPDLFSGRYWIGADALKFGLIDGYATVDSLARDQFKTDNIVDYTVTEDALDKISKKFGASIVDSAVASLSDKSFGSFN